MTTFTCLRTTVQGTVQGRFGIRVLQPQRACATPSQSQSAVALCLSSSSSSSRVCQSLVLLLLGVQQRQHQQREPALIRSPKTISRNERRAGDDDGDGGCMAVRLPISKLEIKTGRAPSACTLGVDTFERDLGWGKLMRLVFICKFDGQSCSKMALTVLSYEQHVCNFVPIGLKFPCPS